MSADRVAARNGCGGFCFVLYHEGAGTQFVRGSGCAGATRISSQECYARSNSFLPAGDLAVTEYKKYLILFPDGRQGDSAFFQTGRAYYLGMEYDAAVQAFGELRSRFPASPHTVEAAYLAGVCNNRIATKHIGGRIRTTAPDKPKEK